MSSDHYGENVVLKAKMQRRLGTDRPYFTEKTRFLVELEHIVPKSTDKTDRGWEKEGDDTMTHAANDKLQTFGGRDYRFRFSGLKENGG